ncbi:MAG: CHASE2 domain-containing protein, partial [Flavobacteriaceae bacterium]
MTALAFRAAALRKLPGLLLIAGLIALHILLDGPLGAFREKSFDAYQQLSPRAESGNPVVLVAIDDLSLKTHGRWPWNRGKLAELVERTAESGAAVVGIDLILAEADTGPEGAAGDARLARALARVPSVVAVSLGHEITSFEAEPKAGWSIVGEVPETLPGFRGLTASLPQFSEAAAGLGVIRSVPDGDGVLRHVPILWLRQGPDRLQLWPSFALELLRLYAGEEGYIARMAGEGFDALRIAGAIVPLEPAGTIRLWESRHDPPRVSAADLLAGRKDARLENAVAIIELSAVGLSQFQLTPTRPARAGGDIHAAAIEQMIAGRYLEAPAMARLFERGWFLIAALIIVGGWGILARRLWVGTFVIALLVLAPLAYGFLAYRLDGELFDPVQPVVGIVLVAAFEGYSLYRRAEERRNTLARQFSQYMSPSVVAQLAESDTAAMLSGEKREITI